MEKKQKLASSINSPINNNIPPMIMAAIVQTVMTPHVIQLCLIPSASVTMAVNNGPILPTAKLFPIIWRIRLHGLSIIRSNSPLLTIPEKVLNPLPNRDRKSVV